MMSRLKLWKVVSLAPRKAALLGCGAVLWASLALAAAAPARADNCPYVTGGRLFFCTSNGTGDLGQQVTTHVGQTVFLYLRVNLSDGTVANATYSTYTTYSAGTGLNFPSSPTPSSFMCRWRRTPTSSFRSTRSTTTLART